MKRTKLNSEYRRILKVLERANSRKLAVDVLRTLLIQKKHYDRILGAINEVGVRKEDARVIKGLTSQIKKIPRVRIQKDGAVIFYRQLSVGCQDCVRDNGLTLRLSTQCNRNCFFCFADESPMNVNRGIDLGHFKKVIDERWREDPFHSFAISGGEPFLYPEAVFKILRYVNRKAGDSIYKRIYSNGDLVNTEILRELKKLNVNEIRYSVKPLEEPKIALLQETKKYIPNVLIEMPVLPNSEAFMGNLMRNLERIGVRGINLLELFYNGYNPGAFKSRGYKIDVDVLKLRRIYNTKPLYEYPIYGSKRLCLKLLKRFAGEQSSMFINFCSQETKQLQYERKSRKIALANKPGYSTIAGDSTHKMLAIYSDVDGAASVLKRKRTSNFYIRRDGFGNRRLETNVGNARYFDPKKYLYAILYRDPSNTYDVGFDLNPTKYVGGGTTTIAPVVDAFIGQI